MQSKYDKAYSPLSTQSAPPNPPKPTFYIHSTIQNICRPAVPITYIRSLALSVHIFQSGTYRPHIYAILSFINQTLHIYNAQILTVASCPPETR